MKTPGTLHGTEGYLLASGPAARGWMAAVGATVAIGSAYFLAAEVGLALRSAPSDVAVFWPASGVAVGILVLFGRRARPALVVGVIVGTIAANLMSDRNFFTALFKGFCNAGEAVLAAWLLEWWFGRPFRFGGRRRIGGFLAAAGLATAASAIGGAATMTLLHTAAPYWEVWRAWFLSDGVGIVVVAPLIIALGQVWQEPRAREEWIEGVGVLALTALLCFYAISHGTGSWLSFTPGAVVLPMLLWLTARCPPTFGIAGAFVASVTVVFATTFGVGRFGDAALPIGERVKAAQVATTMVTLYTLVLTALFAQRKEAEEGMRESERQLAKKSVALARLHEISSRLWLTRDLHQALDEILAGAIELLGADMGAIRIWDSTRERLKIEAQRGFKREYLDFLRQIPAGDSACERALRSGERLVIEDVETDALFAPFRPLARATGYRAMQSTPIMNRDGVPLGMLSTHFRSAHKPDEQDLRLLDLYVQQAGDIIEHHKSDAALRESEERLRLAQLRTGIGLWDWDLRTGKVTWTPELAAIFGLEPGSVKCYADFRDRVHPDDIAAVETSRDEAVRRRETFSEEFRIIRPDGQVRWILSVGGAFYDEATGEPVRTLGNNVDITERKQAELALAERNLQLALAGRAGLVGSYAYDADTEMVQVSEGYAAVHGFPEGTTKIARSQWLTCVHPEDVEWLERRRNEVFQQRQAEYSVDYRILLPGRGVRWIEARTFVSYDGDGHPQRVVGVSIDVTERKRTELALQASEAKFAGILAIAGDAIVSIDASHRITLFNEAAEKVFGYSQAEALGQPIDVLIPTRFRAEHPRRINHFASGPDVIRRVGERQQVVGLRKNSEEFLAEASISKLDVGGECFYTVVMRDISDRKKAELALAERNAQLALAGRAALVGTFAYDVQTEAMQISEGSATIFGFPEGTTEALRSQWQATVHPEDLKHVEDVRSDAFRQQHGEYRVEYRTPLPGRRVRWIEGRSFISYDGDGQPRRVVGVNIDVTERKRAEDRQRVLVAELDHRVKNVLASVSAVVSHTRQQSRSVANFVAALEGRIRSMAMTHELLSAGRWQGISLTELVRRELAPYATRNNTDIDGPEVILRPEAGQAIAIVLHELATNAAKYGALSTRKGRVSIRWDLRLNGQPRSPLVLEWQEIGGPPVVSPSKPSYGTSTIRDLIPYEFGGTVDLVLAPEGVCCRLELPADWLSNDGEPTLEAGTDAPH